MSRYSDAQVVEMFHLSFLLVLQGRLDTSRYVLEGGTNLRYFFGSARYSEDMDLDVVAGKPWSLTKTVDEVLDSPALEMVLRRGGFTVEDHSKPKQTDTVNRWKIGVGVDVADRQLRTKIEFSSRGEDPRHVLEAVPGKVVEPYAIRPPKVQHYRTDAAVEQKVAAAFQDQVAPFLDPSVSELYGPEAWDQMQVFVVDRLEARG